jgi:hypothetical protein
MKRSSKKGTVEELRYPHQAGKLPAPCKKWLEHRLNFGGCTTFGKINGLQKVRVDKALLSAKAYLVATRTALPSTGQQIQRS